MRLWSLSPSYLDRKGLVACWSEGLLAQSVLLKGEYTNCDRIDETGRKCKNGKIFYTLNYGNYIKINKICPKCKGKGKIKTPYYNHPQLTRFKESKDPIRAIGYYLNIIWHEADKRGYKFDFNKINKTYSCPKFLTVTKGQLEYEFNHLTEKLHKRDKEMWWKNMVSIRNKYENIKPHPLFTVVEGDIEKWEKEKREKEKK